MRGHSWRKASSTYTWLSLLSVFKTLFSPALSPLLLVVIAVVLFNLEPFFAHEPLSWERPIRDPGDSRVFALCLVAYNAALILLLANSSRIKGCSMDRVGWGIVLLFLSAYLVSSIAIVQQLFTYSVSALLAVGGAIGGLIVFAALPFMVLLIRVRCMGARLSKYGRARGLVVYYVLALALILVLSASMAFLNNLLHRIDPRLLLPYFREMHPEALRILREDPGVYTRIMPTTGLIGQQALTLYLLPRLASYLVNNGIIGIKPGDTDNIHHLSE